MSIATRRNLEILLSERCVNNAFAMTDVTPVDDREGGEIVSCGEKRAKKSAEMAALFQAMGSGTTTWW